jgi:anti-sigma-K factor RskA
MNEFEWLRQMRDLNQPVAPRNDLWARIDAAIDNAAPAVAEAPAPLKRARHRQVWALAASVAAVMVLAGGIVWHMRTVAPPAPSIAANQKPNTENAPWKPSDPRFAGAAVEFGAARMELQQAMQQAPDSPALQRLLQRTEQQQTQLREQLEKQAG